MIKEIYNEAAEKEPWGDLETGLKEYQTIESGHPINDIYKKAGTPHEEMRVRSAAVAGPPLGVNRVEDLLKQVEKFAELSVGAEGQRGNVSEAEAAISVLNNAREQWSSSTPNAGELDKRLAGFTKARVETFFQELEERMKIANPKNPDAKVRLKIPHETMQKFYQGSETFLGHVPTEKQREEFNKLYTLERRYPAAFLSNILESIKTKVVNEIRPENPRALDPMVPLSALKEHK